MRRYRLLLLLVLAALLCAPAWAQEEPQETEIAPAYPIPEQVQRVLDIARSELGYEEVRGVTKYGEWVGDPQAEWCAEFLCWVVDQADQQLGTQMLRSQFPYYSANNTGRDWFLAQGRYIARKGMVNNWGTQWYTGSDQSMERNSYIPQPGDWVFFSYGATGDTSHVAMVEACYRQSDGSVVVQVIEGNNPSAVARARYPLTDWRIQGYGTVRDLADIVRRMGLEGEKVRALQQRLHMVNLLGEQDITGFYNQRTSDAVKAFQQTQDMPTTGIANQKTQLALATYADQWLMEHSSFWVVDEGSL